MKNLGYLLNRIFSMNFKGVFDVANKVHQKTGKSKTLILFDIVWCGLRHMAGYVDYLIFEMHDLNESQRKTIMTRGRNNAYVRALNDASYHYLFDSKKDFNKTFSKFVKRDWITITEATFEEFENFLNNKDVFFAKPNNGICGRGIENIRIKDYEDPRDLWYSLHDKNLTLLEEAIPQHPEMNALHPTSINTVRLVTILIGDKVHIPASYLRIGNNRIVDNFNSGGMVVPIDVKNGMIHHKAIDKAGNHYEFHPSTNTSIPGFQIPHWEECLTLVKEAAMVVPQMRLIGWDVGISTRGPLLVEANQYPGHDIYQLPVHTPDKIGMLPTFEAIIKVK